MASSNLQDQMKVIIIGAGFSGLSVAYHLLKHDLFEVQILEARQRVGGRVDSYSLDGTMVDLGGQWIHEASCKNPIRKLLDELEIPFHEDPPSGKRVIFNQQGQPVSKESFQSARKLYKRALSNEDDEQTVDISTSFQDLLNQALQSAPNDDDFCQILNHLIHRTEVNEGGRLCEISVHLKDMYQYLGGRDGRPQGGYEAVIQALVSKIGSDRIRLGCVVQSIDYETKHVGGKVTVTTKDGERIEGDYCVCTVPLGVLQQGKIQFIPPLPAPKIKAIQDMGMGKLDKIFLKFDCCFWEYESFSIAHTELSKIKYFYDCSCDVGAPVLELFLGGDAARRVDSQSDDQAVHEAMNALRLAFGPDIPDPVASKVTRWTVDPFALGAYSFTKVGCTEESYEQVASPVGNLLFAGEHTSKTSHSTVHGAWATGQREASRLVGWLKRGTEVR